jgi:hypothetical protein
MNVLPSADTIPSPSVKITQRRSIKDIKEKVDRLVKSGMFEAAFTEVNNNNFSSIIC